MTRKLYLSYVHFRGVTKWPTQACTIPTASFDTLDDVTNGNENGDVGVAGIGDRCMSSTAAGAASSSTNPNEAVHPQARGVPSTVVRAGMITSTSDSRSRMRSLTQSTALWTTRGSTVLVCMLQSVLYLFISDSLIADRH